MKRTLVVMAIAVLVMAVVLTLRGRAQGNALVYADFETVADNRPVSARGELVQLVAFQEDVLHKATLSGGYPIMTFKVREGLSTYKAPLKAFAQPSWVETHIDPKNVFKKLTSINLQVFCDECRPMQGMVVVDNVVFEK